MLSSFRFDRLETRNRKQMQYTGSGRKTFTLLSLLLAVSTHLHFWNLVRRCESYEIKPKRWEYKSRYDVGYEVAKATTTRSNENIDHDRNSTKEPILLLNGFGVGSFHQHRLIHELLAEDNDDGLERTIYCLDYLGQGRSWPKDCRDGLGENEKELQYSADTWCNQIIDFLETIVLPSYQNGESKDDNGSSTLSTSTTRVHLVGNSVGGHLAAHVAVRRPDLVASLCLLNPTPVWGSKLPGWNGHLPAPTIPKTVGRYLFDRIRDLKTIDQFLTATYSRRQAFTDELMHQIRGCTLGNGGHAAFASIMWSPPVISKTESNPESKGDFYDCLKNVSCDVLLVFGKDDPWCKPSFARNMLLALEERKTGHNINVNHQHHRYIEITNAGHCPNHEAPKAVGHLVNQWVNCGEKDRSSEDFSLQQATDTSTGQHAHRMPLTFVEEWGEMVVRERQRDEIEVGWVDKIVTSLL